MAEYDLFISYAEADRAWVEGYLLDSLNQANVRFLSEEAFALGAPRLQEFERAIQQSQRILLVLSPAYVADSFNQFIDLLAQCFGLDTSTWPVIPLLLESVQLPPRLAALVRLDATNPERWEAAIVRLCRDLEHEVPSQIRLPECPYPGMLPFSEANSDRFFGRDQEIEELLERLRLSQFITVIGSSGSGKSSLVLAGLVPALRQSNAFSTGIWLVRTLRPGMMPLTALKEALATDDFVNPAQIVSQLLASHPETQRLLLIVDQFEEVFTPSAETLTSTEIQDRLTFQQVLQNLIDVAACYMVLTVRADFYADLMASLLWRSIRTHRLEITPLDEQGLRSAIVRPAEKMGVFVESALVERLVTDAAGEPGILPLVQETLVLLWSRVERRYLPLRAYEALVLPRKAYGPTTVVPRTGLQVAIARRADTALGRLSNDQQEAIARRIFLRLIQFGEGRADTRRQQPVTALYVADENSYEFNHALFHLVDNRLLTLSGEEETERKVDIAHEALISGWPLLQQWIGERREAEQTRRRLTAKAEEWVRLGKEEGGLLDTVELLEAERWLESVDARGIGYNAVFRELVGGWGGGGVEAGRQQEEAQQRELNLIRETLKQERKARRSAQTRNSIAVVSLIILSSLSIFSFRQSIRSRLKAIEALSASSIAAFESNHQLDALTDAVEAGQLLRQTPFVSEETKIRVVVALQKVAYRIKEYNRLDAHTLDITSVDISPDNQMIASASLDKIIKLWDSNGRLLQTIPGHEEGVISVSFSPNSQVLASASLDNTIRLWERQNDNSFVLATVIKEKNGIAAISFSEDSQFIASSILDGNVKLWKVNGELFRTFRGHSAEVTDVTFSSTGKQIASSSKDGTIKIWNLINGRLIQNFHGKEAVLSLIFLDEETIASANSDSTVKLWSLNGELINTFQGHTGPVLDLSFDQNKQVLASAGEDGTIRLWKPNGLLLETIKINNSMISEIDFDSNGLVLVSGGQDKNLRFWRVDGLASPTLLKGNSFSISPNVDKIVSGDKDGKLSLWNLDGDRIHSWQAHDESVQQVSFHPDAKHELIVSASWDGTVKLWNQQGQIVRILKGHEDGVVDVSFSPDGKMIVTASADGTARLWSIQGQLIEVLEGHEDSVLSANFSPDGKMIVTASADNRLGIWQKRGALLKFLSKHSDSVFNVGFSPSGLIMVSGSADQTVKFWTLMGEHVSTLEGYPSSIIDVKYSSNGSLLGLASFDEVTLLNMDLDDLLQKSCDWLIEYLKANPENKVDICQEE